MLSEEENINEKDNLVLIGMPGVGKSTIGVVLAKILNYQFVDVDLVIQQCYDKTLQSLIDSLGSSAFIEIENEVLAGLDFDHSIISTGGSAIYSEDGMKHLSESGTIIYLKASLEELKRRLSDFSERGIVMRSGAGVSLSDLYAERIPLYEKYADLTVDVDSLDITGSANAVISALGAKR